jgi:hypothetical protein
MASNGQGVCKDASAVPLRITYCDDTHADAQQDQLGNFDYDLHKIWACMDRVGVNGVMRTGFVEEGDPWNGWTAGAIEAVPGGVPTGVPCWNTLNAYNPLGGVTAGDFTLYGALSPFDGMLQHLAAGLGAQPNFAAEYWTGAAWAALTLTTTPDYTCAGGILNQRVGWTLPANWAAATPAQLGLGLINPGTYYYMRLRLTANVGAGPVANTGYKDFLHGHVKRFYCHFGLKRGDDTITPYTTSWNHPGDVVLTFRDGFSLEGRSGIGGTRCNWGAEVGSPAPNRPTINSGATCVVSPGKGPVVFGGLFAGVLFMGKPRHNTHSQAAAWRSSVLPLDMLGCMAIGCWSANTPLGGAGSALVRRLTNVRFTLHPLYDSGPVAGYLSPYAVSTSPDAIVDRLIVDVRENCGFAIRSTVSGQSRMDGLYITDDAVVGGAASAQVLLQGAGPYDIVGIEWGGPNEKLEAAEAYEWRKLAYTIREDASVTPLVGLPVRYRKSDGTLVADVLTDTNGTASYVGPGSGTQNADLFPASEWHTPNNEVEVENDALLYVEINPDDHASFNPAYQSLIVRAKFPRDALFDYDLGIWTERDWQRKDLQATISLPLAVAGGGGGPTGPITVDALPLEADSVERILAEVPQLS